MTVTEIIETKLEEDEELYIGEEEEEEESESTGVDGSSLVADGKYVVPKGVVVEELKNFSGHKDLKNKCPKDVRAMLEEKGLFDVYDKFLQTIFDTKNTRGPTGKWQDQQFISILDQFRDDFTEKGIKICFCKRKSGIIAGSFRWLEFIDVEALDEPYNPQFNVSNFSGQVIKTIYKKLQFPNGVAVEELKLWGGRKKLKENIPIHVENLLKKKDLMSEYSRLVDHIVEAGIGYNMLKKWKNANLTAVLKEYKPMFFAKGVDIFFSQKREWVSHGTGGHYRYFRWIEFVDREEQPSYYPQYDFETNK